MTEAERLEVRRQAQVEIMDEIEEWCGYDLIAYLVGLGYPPPTSGLDAGQERHVARMRYIREHPEEAMKPR